MLMKGFLVSKMIGTKIVHFNEIDSTNTYLKKHYKEYNFGTVVSSNHQTKGYGRKGRIWYDDQTNSLMFSIYIYQELNDTLGLLTQLVAASMVKTLQKYNVNARIKWPNDIIVSNKKICGILVENIIENNKANVIIGIGLNVNNKSFDSSIQNIATSMYLETGNLYNKKELLSTFISQFNTYYCNHVNNQLSYLDICREHSYLIGKSVTLETGEVAEVLNIDNIGRLVVKINNKVKTFIGSEVTLHHIYKK